MSTAYRNAKSELWADLEPMCRAFGVLRHAARSIIVQVAQRKLQARTHTQAHRPRTEFRQEQRMEVGQQRT